MANTFGNIWADRDPGHIQRGNRKTVSQLTGTEIDALIIDANLTSQYVFAGNGNDSVGSNNLTENGTPTYDADGGPDGQFIILNGSSQYLTASANTVHDITTGDFSITGWIYRSSDSGGTEFVLAKKAGSGNVPGYIIIVDAADRLSAEFDDNSGSAKISAIITSPTIAVGTWYHFAAVFDRDANLTLYLNGTVGDTEDISGRAASCTNAQTFTVGRDSNASIEFFPGRMDDIRFYTKALSAAEVKSIMNDLRGGQICHCTETSAGYTAGITYRRNAENSAFNSMATLDTAETFSAVKTYSAAPLINNNVGLTEKNSGGTSRQSHKRNASNILELGDSTQNTGLLANEPYDGNNKNHSNIQLLNAKMHFTSRVPLPLPAVLTMYGTGGGGTETISQNEGYITLTTDSAAGGNDAFIATDFSTSPFTFIRGDRAFELSMIINLAQTATTELEVGVIDTSPNGLSANTNHHISIVYDASTSANWIARNANGTNQTSTTSGTAVTAAAHVLTIVNKESSIEFYVDGTLIATHSTNLPTTTTMSIVAFVQTETTAAKTMHYLGGMYYGDIV